MFNYFLINLLIGYIALYTQDQNEEKEMRERDAHKNSRKKSASISGSKEKKLFSRLFDVSEEDLYSCHKNFALFLSLEFD